jgi:hypothetical protein
MSRKEIAEEKKKIFHEKVDEAKAKLLEPFKSLSTKIKLKCCKGHINLIKPLAIVDNVAVLCKDYAQNFIDTILEWGGTPIDEYKTSDVYHKCLCPNNHEIEVVPGYFGQNLERRGRKIICNECDIEAGRKSGNAKINKPTSIKFREVMEEQKGEILEENVKGTCRALCLCKKVMK